MRKIKICILVLLVTLVMAGCGEKKIDPSEYVTVCFAGINGKATATAEFDLVSMEENLIGEDVDDINRLKQIARLENSIECELSKSSAVSNGDTIKVLISWNENLAKECGIKFTTNEKIVEATGIEEGTVLDLFEGIELDYAGVSPEASVSIRNTSQNDFISRTYYSIDKSTGIANGDIIKVTADCDLQRAENEGYIIEQTEKTFTVEGIDAYLTEYSQIDEETLGKLETQAQDLIESRLADSYSYINCMYPSEMFIGFGKPELEEVTEIKLMYAYFFDLKEGLVSDDWGTVNNSLFLVYSVTAKDSNTPEGKTTLFPIYYSNFILRDSGKIDVVVTDAKIAYDTYDNFDNMYREIVTANKEKYTYEEISF